MLETIKTVGSFAGLVSAAFLVWDRWARGRPVAEPAIKLAGVNPFKFVRIKNPGPGSVFVQGVRAYPPGIYGVAKNHSADATLQAMVPEIYGVADLQILLRSGEKCDFPIIDPPKNKAVAPSQRVRFVVSWRKTSSALWQVPAWFTISIRGFIAWRRRRRPTRSTRRACSCLGVRRGAFRFLAAPATDHCGKSAGAARAGGGDGSLTGDHQPEGRSRSRQKREADTADLRLRAIIHPRRAGAQGRYANNRRFATPREE
jgi:hypothetical protein